MEGTDGKGWRKARVGARARLVLVALCVALLFGTTGLGAPVEDLLRIGRNLLNRHPASAEIVVVAIDDKSLNELARWPWPRRHHAELMDKLVGMGASRIFFDIAFSSPSEPADDRLLADAFRRADGRVVLPVLELSDPITGEVSLSQPLQLFAQYTAKADIRLDYDYRGSVWLLPYARQTSRGSVPTYSAMLARAEGNPGEKYMIDYSIDLRTVPQVSAIDVIRGRVPRTALAGKTVVVGGNSGHLGDNIFFPGQGIRGAVFVHVLGAETLKAGRPLHLGWFLPLTLAILLSILILRFVPARRGAALLALLTGALLAVPIWLERSLVFVDIVPALLLLAILTGRLGWIAVRKTLQDRAMTHSLSGLPTLQSLMRETVAGGRPLVVARFTNFAEISASLLPETQKELIAQIAGRLALGNASNILYQGDEGIFAWLADDEMTISIVDHLNALHSLFRSPVRVGGSQIDLAITFGVECGSDRSMANRLGGAMLAAEEAAADGQRWKFYDAARLADAPWRLSLLSQLDAAIGSGDIWVAYQPQVDLSTRRIVGAEALVRWTHPDKGPIAPADFITAAEQSGRIQALTWFVLDQAVQAAARINARGIDFGVAVNLSARMLDDPDLQRRVFGILQSRKLDPRKLTLEITETAALDTGAKHLEPLTALRQGGVRVSIDDYGTGLSTLEYVRRIPADEIKIDRSFVQSMHREQGDRLIVESTIRLAHSLGRQVVAEGVEDRESLHALGLLGCDLAQGFFIGRPMPWPSFESRLLEQDDVRQVGSG